MRIGWLLVIAQVVLASYSLRAICSQIGRDRRCPSRDRIMAIHAAYWTTIATMAVGAALWLTQDRRYVITTEWLHLGCIAASVVAALAIRTLQGDGGRGDRR